MDRRFLQAPHRCMLVALEDLGHLLRGRSVSRATISGVSIVMFPSVSQSKSMESSDAPLDTTKAATRSAPADYKQWRARRPI